MRRGTIVAGLTAGVLGVAGAGTAVAADLPITITFTQGSTKAGSLPALTTASPATPATFSGTISTTTLRATFPDSSVKLPDATADNVDFGGLYGSGKLTLKTTPLSFTGAPSVSIFSLDLTGTLAYAFVATAGGTTYTCNSEAPIPVKLTGTAIDPAGSYSASGSQTNLLLRAANLQDPLQTAFCLNLSTKVLPAVGMVTSSFAGKLAIPGLIPAGAPAAPTTTTPGTTPTVPTTPTTPTTPATPATPKAAKLTVSVSKPATVNRGRSAVTKVVVRNTGAGTARSVSLKVAALGRGITPRSSTKSYASIAAGRTRTFSVRLRSTRSAVRSSEVRATVRAAGGLTATRSATLRLR